MYHRIRMVAGNESGDSVASLARQAIAYRAGLVQFFRRKTRDTGEIEDLVQEVFLRISARRSGDAIDNLGGYVFQTAASVLADRHRRRTVRHADDHVEFDTERHAANDFDAAHIVETRQSLRAAVAALEILPERTRAIFILRRLEGHPYRDIAEQFGISISAVEKHMVRAVQHLMNSPGCR
jgi:RNA polymerase sigma factor (sigma-70 family)